MSIRIADHWFERKTIDEEITMLWEPNVDPLVRCNIWHVRGRDKDMLIDTGLGVCSLREAARDAARRARKAETDADTADRSGHDAPPVRP